MGDATPEDVYREVNRVQPSLIRVEADEVTYNLHILIRFELELALVRGQLEVADLPGEWDAAYDRRLGVRPPHAGVGVLQDVHWSSRVVRLLPDVHPREPLLGHPVGADRGRPPRHRRAARPGRVRAAARLAAHAHPPPRVPPRGRRPDPRGHRLAASARPVHALPVGQVRAAVRRRERRRERPERRRRPLLRPRRDLEPVAATSARSPTRCSGGCAALGLDPVEDDSGARTGSNIGNIHVALPPTDGGDGHADLPERPPRHGAAGRRRRAGDPKRHRRQPPRHDPRRRQQGGGRGDARGGRKARVRRRRTPASSSC